ncbi:hypothetical protein BDA99DRAFT_584955 [Phascolomyces articulosus]|uniref:SET domain-containing protein n=1 Tax=Phascolomyces articulosus TaxID=60185 RepID=A0AAD5PBW2_9FUNG|nr:hypothetical protein BDA99DRAFT_584955 [Phascolomyces articulosus]
MVVENNKDDIKNDPKADSEPKKKSNKKKKKSAAASGPIDPIDPYYEQVMQKYPVFLRNTRAKGRHATANKQLEEGTALCLEQGTAFVVRSEYIDQHCHVCLNSLITKMMCSDCRKVYYCSKDCLERDDTHTLVCSTLVQVDSIARATDVDPDLLRLITLLLARRQRDNEAATNTNGDGKDNGESDQKSKQTLTPTPFWCTNDLLSHRNLTNPAFIHVVKEAGQRLLSEMPESMQIPVDDLITLACRINSNAHGLGDNEARNTDVALGLFPVSALFFNHACNPNCAFVGLQNGRLTHRTIRPVQRDEELTVSYIDLYASRDERRQDLLGSKHFWCKCKRCTSPMDTSVDRFLQSTVCKTCHEDVYVIPPSSLDDLTHGKSMEPSGEWKCAKCGSTASAQSISATIQQAQQLYTEGMMAIRKQRDYSRARAKLETLVTTKKIETQSVKGGDLHPRNAIRFNASIPLMNCLRHNQDINAAINVNRYIIETMEAHAKENLPRNTPEISDFWQNLGELCELMASKNSDRAALNKRWKKEAREAFDHAARVRAVVFGPDHPKTVAVMKLASSV